MRGRFDNCNLSLSQGDVSVCVCVRFIYFRRPSSKFDLHVFKHRSSGNAALSHMVSDLSDERVLV